jgi:hypothetical protein
MKRNVGYLFLLSPPFVCLVDAGLIETLLSLKIIHNSRSLHTLSCVACLSFSAKLVFELSWHELILSSTYSSSY